VIALLAGAVAAVYVLRGEDNPVLRWTAVSTASLPAGVSELSSVACPTVDECWLAGPEVFVHLRGGELTVVALPEYSPLSVACRAPDDCWAGSAGYFGAYHYDGREWTYLPRGIQASADGLALAGRVGCTRRLCVAGGGPGVLYALVWDGTGWRQSELVGDAGPMRSLFCTGTEECYGFGVSDGQPRVFRLAEGRWTVTDEVGRREIRTADWVVSQCPTADDCVVMFSGAPMNMRPWAEIAHIRDGRWVSTDAVNLGLPDNLWAYDLSCL
jgi:hypothetical protein